MWRSPSQSAAASRPYAPHHRPVRRLQGGGIFRSANIEYNSEDDKAIKKVNEQVIKGFGLKHGAAHSEYIKCDEDGKIYFLETSSRVGGAHLAEMVASASDINLWSEWASIENALAKGLEYKLPKVKKEYAGSVFTPICIYIEQKIIIIFQITIINRIIENRTLMDKKELLTKLAN